MHKYNLKVGRKLNWIGTDYPITNITDRTITLLYMDGIFKYPLTDIYKHIEEKHAFVVSIRTRYNNKKNCVIIRRPNGI